MESLTDNLMEKMGNQQNVYIEPDSECLENHQELLIETYSEASLNLSTNQSSKSTKLAQPILNDSSIKTNKKLDSQNILRSLSVVSTRTNGEEVLVNKYSPDDGRNNVRYSRSLEPIDCPAHIKPVDNNIQQNTVYTYNYYDDVPDIEALSSTSVQTSNNSDSTSIPSLSPTTTLSRASFYNCTEDHTKALLTPQNSGIIPQDVKGLRKELDEKIKHRASLQKELKLSEEKYDKLQEKFDTVERKNIINTDKIRELNDQTRKLTINYELEKQEKLGLEKHQKWLQEKSEQLLAEKSTLKQEFASLKTINLNNKMNIEKERKEKAKLDSVCVDLKTKELKEKEAIAKTLEKVEEEMASKEILLEELESQNNQEIQKNNILLKDVLQLQKNLSEEEKVHNKLKNEHRRSQEASKVSKSRLIEYEKKNDSLKRKLSELITDNENEKSSLTQVQQNRNVLEVQKNAIEKHLEEKDKSLNEIVQEKERLENELTEFHEKNLYLTSLLDQKQLEVDETDEKLIESGLEQNAKLRALQKAQTERDSYQTKIKMLKINLENLKQSSELNEKELLMKIDLRERELQNVEGAIQDINEKMNNYELELDEMAKREAKHMEELTQFKIKVKECDFVINERANYIRELENNNSTLQDGIKLIQLSKDEEIRKLHEAVNAWKSKLQLKDTEIQSNITIAKQFQSLESTNREKEKVIHKLKMEQQQLEDKLSDKADELYLSNQKFEQMEKSVKEEYMKLENDKCCMLNKSEQKLKILEDRNNSLNSEHLETVKENKNTHLQLNEAKFQMDYLAQENQQIAEMRVQIEQQFEKMQIQKNKEQDTLIRQINSDKANSSALEEEIFKLSEANENKDEFLKKLSIQANEAFENKKNEDAETERRLAENDKKINGMLKYKQSDDATIKALKSRIKRLEADEKSWKNDKLRLENDKKLQNKAISNTDSKYNNLEGEMKRCVNNQISLEGENVENNKIIINLTNKLAVTEDQLRIMTDSLGVSQDEVTEMKESISNLEAMYKISEQRHQGEICKLKGIYSTLEEANSSLAYRNTPLEKDKRSNLMASPRFENNFSGSKNREALQHCIANLRVDMTKIQGQMYKQAENINTTNAMSQTLNARLQNSPKSRQVEEDNRQYLSKTPKQKRKNESINDKLNSSDIV